MSGLPAEAPAVEWMEDGTPIDPATGEVLAPDDPAVVEAVKARLVAEPIRIDTEAQADAALAHRSAIIREIVALDIEIAAKVERHRKLVDARKNRLAWWDRLYGDAVIGHARRTLKGKAKTRTYLEGEVVFRTSPGTLAVLDDARAVAYVETWRPDLVKVEKSVTQAAIRDACREAAEATGEPVTIESLPWVKRSAPVETVKIKTCEDDALKRKGLSKP